MKHSVPHDLSPDLAKRATEKAIQTYCEKFADYNPSVNWSSDSKANVEFKVKGIALKGEFNLVPKAIEIDMKVPFALKLFQGKAVQVVDKAIRQWIDRAKAGEL